MQSVRSCREKWKKNEESIRRWRGYRLSQRVSPSGSEMLCNWLRLHMHLREINNNQKNLQWLRLLMTTTLHSWFHANLNLLPNPNPLLVSQTSFFFLLYLSIVRLLWISHYLVKRKNKYIYYGCDVISRTTNTIHFRIEKYKRLFFIGET